MNLVAFLDRSIRALKSRGALRPRATVSCSERDWEGRTMREAAWRKRLRQVRKKGDIMTMSNEGGPSSRGSRWKRARWRGNFEARRPKL